MRELLIIFTLLYLTTGEIAAQVNQEWVQRFTSSGSRSESVNDMCVDAQGNIYVTGSQNDPGFPYSYRIESVTVKYNSQGVQQWIQNYIAPDTNGAFTRAIHVDAAGNVYVTGVCAVYSGGSTKMLVIKYSPSGTQLWSYLFQYSTGGAQGYDIITDATGNVYVTGEYYTDVTYLNNIFISKFSPAGALIGQTLYHFGSEGARKIALDGAGKIIVGGYCNINQADSSRFIVLKYEQNLDLVWATRCGSKGTGDPGSLIDMTVDINSNPIITGINNYDYAVFKINNDGTLSWNKFHNHASDIPRGVAADNLGNIYITGETGAAGFPLSYRITTIKYNPNGDEQWIRNYNGGAIPDGYRGYGLVLDNSANVYITGAVSSTSNIVTLKYNTNGTFQWARSYNGPSNSADYPSSLAVDGSGNTFTAGTSYDNTTNYDIALVKYAPVALFQNNFSRNALSKTIPDNSSALDTITVDYSSAVNYYVYDVNLKIDTVLHANDSDLEFYLIHNGNTDTVIYREGGAGDNFINTILNDSAANPISGGSSPFSGSFRPHKQLNLFNGSDINGTWILKVYDRAAGNTGTLKAWSLDFLIFTIPLGITGIGNVVPKDYMLSQNYPNPFNPVTNIRFSIPKSGFVMLSVYDVLGREVRNLVNENLTAGIYNVDWDASLYSSGVYFYRIDAGTFSEVKKMILLK